MHSILNGVPQLTQSKKETNIRKIFGSGSRYVPRKKFTRLFILKNIYLCIYLFKESVSIFDYPEGRMSNPATRIMKLEGRA